MSETPRPLWELVEQWEKSWCGPTIGGALQVCAGELAAALRAWDAVLATAGQSTDQLQEYTIRKCHEYTRRQLLGVPPKEPAQKDREVTG